MIQAIELGDRLRFYPNWLNQRPIETQHAEARDETGNAVWEISEPTRWRYIGWQLPGLP